MGEINPEAAELKKAVSSVEEGTKQQKEVDLLVSKILDFDADFGNEFPDIPPTLNDRVADKLIEEGWGDAVADNLDKFHNLDHSAIADKLIEKKWGGAVADNLDKFRNLDHSAIADKLIEKGQGFAVARNLDKFHNLNPAIADKLIEEGWGDAVANNLDKFSGLTKDRPLGGRLLESLAIGGNRFDDLIRVNNAYQPPLDRLINKTAEIFGDFATAENYRLIKELNAGGIPAEAGELGVRSGGEKGMSELSRKLESFRTEMIREDFDPEVLLKSPALLNLFKNIVRFDSSQWGGHEEEDLKQSVKTFIRLRKSGELDPLKPEYLPGKADILRVDEEAQKAFQYSEPFLNRYGLLLRSIQSAERAVDEKNPKLFSKLTSEITAKLQPIISDLEAKSAAAPNPKAKEAMAQKIADLKSLDLRSIKSFQKNFSTLADFKELHEDLRQVLFSYALKKNPDWRRENFNRYAPQPAVDQITRVLDFVDHIVNQETFDRYFTDPRAAKKFRELINIRALEEELSRAQNQATKGAIPFEFIPTRGLLTELSGHIADACWASKYKSILKEFPNFTPVIMVQNPDNKHRRLAGAAFLIEAESESGEPLLIARGLNPQENVINNLSVQDFYEKFMSFAGQIAEKSARKLAVVIDDHSGGSSTNRPVLFNFLSQKARSLKKIPLSEKSKTRFNGYDITRDVFLAE